MSHGNPVPYHVTRVAPPGCHEGQETPPRHVGPGSSAHPVTCLRSHLGEQREVPAGPRGWLGLAQPPLTQACHPGTREQALRHTQSEGTDRSTTVGQPNTI